MSPTIMGQTDWYSDPDLLLSELRAARDARAPRPAITGYDLIQEIRRGGQGVVYSAVQQSTKRRVALKVLYDDATPSETRRLRFEREIELVAALQHPSIVRVYDSGVAADGRLYLAMEQIEGVPLDEWTVRTDSATEETHKESDQRRRILALFAAVCDAVGHAHLHGVIHRDLKPGNILVDSTNVPHVLDFGVARAFGPTGRSFETLTRPGHFLGTLAYAAPEQVRNESAAVDVRVDVYALGVILYELLTGSPPYRTSGSLTDTISAITVSHPPAPSKAGTPKRRRRAPWTFPLPRWTNDELDAIVLKALAKDPVRRYPSAIDFGSDIKRLLAGQPVEAKRDSGWYDLRKMLQRHRVAFAATVFALLLFGGFGFAMSVLYRRSLTEANKTEQIRRFLEDTLGSVDAARYGPNATVRQVLDEAVHWIELALADQPEVAASLHNTLGNSYRSLGLFEQAEKQLDHALRLRKTVLGPSDPSVAQTLSGLGLLELQRGNLEKAELLHRAALDIRRSALGTDHPEISYSLQNLADVLRRRGDFAEAEKQLLENLALRKRVYGERHAEVAMAYYKLGELAADAGRAIEAIEWYRQALDIRRGLLRSDHPDIANSIIALARVLLLANRAQEAESILRECLAARTSLPVDWRLAAAEGLLAEALIMEQKFDQAAAHARTSLAVLRDIAGESHEDTQSARLRLKRVEETLAGSDTSK